MASKNPFHTHLVEKTPDNALYVEVLLRTFSDVKYIHLGRNTDATVASMVKWGGIPFKHMGRTEDETEMRLFTEWINYRGKRLSQKYPEQCYYLDFDNWMRMPRLKTLELLEWLGLEWNDEWYGGLQFRTERGAYYCEEGGSRPDSQKSPADIPAET